MIGLAIAIIIVVLLAGLVLKLVKVAFMVALGIGVVMLVQAKFGNKRIR